MAGDWIPIRINLRTDPRTIKIATMIRRTPQHAIGCLVQVWSAANEHSTDGKLLGYTLDSIDELTATKGFAAAFAAVGWLIVEPDGVRIPDFDRYNSDGAKARLKHSRLVAESRNRHKDDTKRAQNRHISVTNESTTEQNRREEKNSSSSFAASAGAAAADFSNAILKALHDRGIGEPTATMLLAEGCEMQDIRAADKGHSEGDGPGLTVNRVRESIAARGARRAQEAKRAAVVEKWRNLGEDAQAELIARFRGSCAAEGREVRHMSDAAIALWARFVDWMAEQPSGGVA